MSDRSTASPLVSNTARILWPTAMAAAAFFGSTLLASLFLGLFLLTGLIRLWGRLAIDRVRLSVSCTGLRLFPGQTTVLSYHLENPKFLPLPWLELTQNGPDDGCLVPGEGYTAFRLPGTPPSDPPALRQSFAGVRSYGTLTTDQIWTAAHRGIYRLHAMGARSGDGFGLIQRECPLPDTRLPLIAVYPALVDVDTAPFLRCQWDARASRHGWMEDQTILRGSREYQPGDSWKAINWRMAAREQGLPVNLYQSISPYSVRFILDGESFRPQPEMLEEALSILASLLLALSARSMEVSLSISQGRDTPACTLTSEGGSGTEDMLLQLAGFHCLARPVPGAEPVDGAVPLLPSCFAPDAIPRTGSTWLITRSGSVLPDPLIRRLQPASSRILCFEDWDAPARIGLHAIPIRNLRSDS